MTDLREGLSHAAHQTLDLLEQLRDAAGDLYPVQHLELGRSRAAQALRSTKPDMKRHFALQAAAHLILAVELNDAAQHEGEQRS